MYRIFVAGFIYIVSKAWDSLNACHQGFGSVSTERQHSGLPWRLDEWRGWYTGISMECSLSFIAKLRKKKPRWEKYVCTLSYLCKPQWLRELERWEEEKGRRGVCMGTVATGTSVLGLRRLRKSVWEVRRLRDFVTFVFSLNADYIYFRSVLRLALQLE